LKLSSETPVFSEIRVSQYPDGGLTRLGLYQDLPENVKGSFDGICRSYEDSVPSTVKPLNIDYDPTLSEINKNWQIVKGEFNNASLALGAKVIKATDEHYSPAAQALSPFEPINMFDGMESARSRIPGHFEELVIKLAKVAPIHRVELDYTYFVNNNPLEITLDGFTNGKWIPIISKINVKPYAGNKKIFEVSLKDSFEEIRLKNYPCGGMNRIKVFSK
jgi:allantoicase